MLGHFKIRNMKSTLSPGAFFIIGEEFKLYIISNKSLIFDKYQLLLAHIKCCFLMARNTFLPIGTYFGLSDEYRNVPYRLENI